MTTKILFLDKNHNKSSEAQAKWKVIHEYDTQGELVKEAWVDLKRHRG